MGGPILAGLPENGPFLAIDTEGSGGKSQELIEFAGIEFDLTGEVLQEKAWLIRPRGTISYWATRVHQITKEDLVDAPFVESVAPQIARYLDGATIVAHNAPSDLGILRRHVAGWSPKSVFDTLRISRKVFPEHYSHKLYDLRRSFGLTAAGSQTQSHRAYADARVCMELFLYLVSVTST